MAKFKPCKPHPIKPTIEEHRYAQIIPDSPPISPEERRRVADMMAGLAKKLTYAGAQKRRESYIEKPRTTEDIARDYADRPLRVSQELKSRLKRLASHIEGEIPPI